MAIMSLTTFGAVENIESYMVGTGEPAIPSIPGTTCLQILMMEVAQHQPFAAEK
jgi:hypothetical protein